MFPHLLKIPGLLFLHVLMFHGLKKFKWDLVWPSSERSKPGPFTLETFNSSKRCLRTLCGRNCAWTRESCVGSHGGGFTQTAPEPVCPCRGHLASWKPGWLRSTGGSWAAAAWAPVLSVNGMACTRTEASCDSEKHSKVRVNARRLCYRLGLAKNRLENF